MKLTKEQLKRIIKEEIGSIKEGWTRPFKTVKTIDPDEESESEKVRDTTGFFSGPGFDDEEEEEERSPGNIQSMRERAIEIINEMSPNELVRLLRQINPET